MSSGDVKVDEPKVKATSIAAIMTSLPTTVPMMEIGGHELLADPMLVENYSDILKKKPDQANGAGGGETDLDSESASGSVVVTRSSANTSPAKKRGSVLSNSSSHYSLRGLNDGLPLEGLEKTVEEEEEEEEQHKDEDGEEAEEKDLVESLPREHIFPQDDATMEIRPNNLTEMPSEDMTHDYEYSDSDFEEDMEKRLQDLNASDSDSDVKGVLGEGAESDHMVLGLSLSDDENSDAEDELHLRLEDDLEADSGSDEYQPLSPPKELDPEKLYALYAFSGPDPSHCQLRQDESCTLLNDQDAYWWLVRRSYDSKIGFAPAEILETFPERLARLNCWKNENMSSQLSAHTVSSDNVHGKQESGSESSADEELAHKLEDKDKGIKSNVLKDYVKDNKSVSFNDVVSYADRFVEENVDADDTVDAVHYDEFTEADLKLNRLAEEDEVSEVVSDTSFSTAAMAPLKVEKVRRPKVNSDQKAGILSDARGIDSKSPLRSEEKNPITKDQGDDLHKIFEAPIAPFGKNHTNNGNRMQTSTSDYSISTIGDFSPSSSEWTNDSPQLQNEQFGTEQDSSAMPSSRAIQDFSKYVEEDESLNTINGDTAPQDKSVDSTNEPNKAEANETLSESKHNSITSTSSSSEQIFMDSERINSFTSINSAASVSKHSSHAKSCLNTATGKRHPIIDRLYNPIFDRMDELMKVLDQIANE